MADKLPAGFLSVGDAHKRRDGQVYDLIGICTDYLPPTRSRGTDLTMKIHVWDTSCSSHFDIHKDGMLVRFFAKTKSQMPRIEEAGDVVVFRNIKTKNVAGQWLGLSNYDTRWNVINGLSLSESKGSEYEDVELRKPYDGARQSAAKQDVRPGRDVFKYAKALLQQKDPSTFSAPPNSTALDVAMTMTASDGQAPFRLLKNRKFRLVKDLVSPFQQEGAYQFVDLLGEIKRVYFGNHNTAEVMLTDYTEHELLYEYSNEGREGDVFGYSNGKQQWTGPWGKRTITVTAWDEHAEYIGQLNREGKIHLGMYMRMRNVQIKMDRNGEKLEGHMRGAGSNSGTGLTVHHPTEADFNEDMKSLLERKRAYDREVKARGLHSPVDGAGTQKRPVESEHKQEPENKKGKTSTKHKKKKERLKAARERRPAASDAPAKAQPKLAVNEHVRCEAIDIPLTKVAAILNEQSFGRETPSGNEYTLPFQNCKYKSKVQVVDFFPDNLEDFATPFKTNDYDALSDHDSEDDDAASLSFAQENPDNIRWKWHFFLMVQDPESATLPASERPTMLLQVSGQDGDQLLNMEARDLRADTRGLAKMKEKLFVLWGDLGEKKSEGDRSGLELQEANVVISSKPFECLIKEFGVHSRTDAGKVLQDRWERMFGIFNTTIG